MRKFLRKTEDVLSRLTCAAFSIAVFITSLGALIWSTKWVLKLVGVM